MRIVGVEGLISHAFFSFVRPSTKQHLDLGLTKMNKIGLNFSPSLFALIDEPF